MNIFHFVIICNLLKVCESFVPSHLVFHDEEIENLKLFKDKLTKLRLSVELLEKFDGYSYGDDMLSKYQLDVFHQYVSLFRRAYNSNHTEYEYRFDVFRSSLARHSWLNKKERKFNGTAYYGLNKFSDWTTEEFQSLLSIKHSNRLKTYVGTYSKPFVNNGSKSRTRRASTVNTNDCVIDESIPFPKTVNWLKKSTPIKDQKNCGSCWAFVASEQIETYDTIAGNPLIKRSPQELLSCAPSLGCNGGNTCGALSWMVHTQRVLVSEQQYPYEGADTQCKYNSMKPNGPKIKSVCGCTSLVQQEDLMLRALHQKGPLAVNVDAVLWHDYVGGIIQHHCTDINMNHAVQLIGYNLNDGPVPYWLARNQWGVSFGEDGFIRLKYGANMCGIADEPSFVVVE